MGMANQIVQHSNAEVWVSELVYPWAVDLKKMLDLRDEALQSAFNEYIPGEKSFKFGFEQLKKYWDERGGRIQWIAQCVAKTDDPTEDVKKAIDGGAAGAFLIGNVGDLWAREGRVDLIGKVV